MHWSSNSLEELETIIDHQGAGLPDWYIDVEDSNGTDVDLSTGYDTFSAVVLDETGAEVNVGTLTVTGTATGFRVQKPAAGIVVAADQYKIRCKARHTSTQKYRHGYALLELLTG
jgi:hypothetical protein